MSGYERLAAAEGLIPDRRGDYDEGYEAGVRAERARVIAAIESVGCVEAQLDRASYRLVALERALAAVRETPDA